MYNVLDVILTVNLVLSFEEPSECEFYSADVNEDGTLNILDVIGIINLILDRSILRELKLKIQNFL